VTIAAYAVMWFTVKQSLPADVINGGGTFPEWVRQLPFYLTFTQNWSYPNFTDMGILWSLGVEEQFYLAFPFVFLLAATRGWFLHIVAALIVAAVTWRLSIMTFAPHHYVYYVTPTYFDVFALGAVAGWLAATGNIPKLLTLPGIGSLIVIALVTLGYLAHDNLFQPYKLWTAWIYSGLAITNAAALLWVVSNPNSITSQALRTAMMSKLGRISFGVYMWHIIARTIVTVIWPQTADGDVYFISFFAAYVGLSVLLATASYWLIEKPFLSFKKSTSPASSLATV
jgi:peptidoglycan/LPS O-acetylase OafA/YrhL